MSAEEFSEWIAYFNIDPPRDTKSQYEVASICATMARIWGSGKGAVPEIKDFLLEYNSKTKETPKKTIEERMKELPKPEDVEKKLKLWLGGYVKE